MTIIIINLVICRYNQSGNIIFGAPNYEQNIIRDNTVVTVTGSVKIYIKNNNNEWVQKGNDIIGNINTDHIGKSVSMSDDGNVIAFTNQSGNGSVTIMEYDNSLNIWQNKGLPILGVEDNLSIDIDNRNENKLFKMEYYNYWFK